MARQVFYSFHYQNDVMRTQQVRNMGRLCGNKPATPNKWEEVKRSEAGIEKWIDDNLNGKTCLIVLIGSETASRKWVKYEIKKAWKKRLGIVGIYIHNLECPNKGFSAKGKNPFSSMTLGESKFDSIIKTYDPSSYNTYSSIEQNIEKWIEEAIQIRNKY